MRLMATSCRRELSDVSAAKALAGSAWRRSDPLTRFALAAITDLQLDHWHPQTGLVVASAYGAVTTTQRFVDSIAQHGDADASPAAFAGSVHSSTAGSIGLALGIHGPCTTIAQGSSGLSAALRWSQLMLAANRCPQVLVIAGEGHSDYSSSIVERLISTLPWEPCSGCAAWLLSATNGKREIRHGEHSATQCLDNGGGSRAEQALSAAAQQAQQQRLRAGDLINGWLPAGVALATHQTLDADALQLRECGDDGLHAWWLGPSDS